MFDFVPFTGSRREMADRDLQAGLIGQLLCHLLGTERMPPPSQVLRQRPRAFASPAQRRLGTASWQAFLARLGGYGTPVNGRVDRRSGSAILLFLSIGFGSVRNAKPVDSNLRLRCAVQMSCELQSCGCRARWNPLGSAM